jgi:hypothetical protein
MMPLPILLGQAFESFDAPTPPALPSSPVWERYLLENPYPAVILLLIGAMVVWRIMNNAMKRREAAIGAAACVVVAGGVFVLARTVETTRERLKGLTFALVRSTAEADIASLDPLLDDKITLFRPGGGPSLDKGETLERVRNDLGKSFRVKEWAVLELQADVDTPTSAMTQARIRVTLQMSAFPTISWWKLDWRRDAAGVWRVISIDPVSVPQAVRSQLR